MKRYGFVVWTALIFAWLTPAVAHADVTRVEVAAREDVLGGRGFGAAGAYEWLIGRAYFTLDPLNPRNAIVVDLALAPRNGRGVVEFFADLMILRPKDAAKANGVVLFDVVNRGRPQILSYLNEGTGASRTSESYIGDGLLMKQGFTIVWLGWQQDLPAPPDLLHLFGPKLIGVTGLVAGEVRVPVRTDDVPLAERRMIPAQIANPRAPENRLTVRDTRNGTPRMVPRDDWTFGRMENGAVVDDPTRLYLKGGFDPGRIYQIVYLAKDPHVAGLGLAAVRDLIAWIRHDATAVVRATHAYAFGISQSGRFLRQFLHDGFNADLAGRQVFDGMMIHIAGGSSRGFDERFTQPSGSMLSRVFPFTDVEQTDLETGARDGLLTKAQQAGVVPKVIHTSSSWEYWGSVASAIHTTVDGGGDVEVSGTSRAYLLAGTQHVPPAFPPRYPTASTTAPVTGAELVATIPERGQLRLNPLNYRPVLRALFVALDQWVRVGAPPPPSRVPRLADRTLVRRVDLNVKGYTTASVPGSAQQWARLDAGEVTRGIPTIVPPRAGTPYVGLVPQVDDDGNDIAGVRVPDLSVPLATHTGWSLRDPSIGAPTDLVQQNGSYSAFARTRAERERNGDPRRSIEERYPSLEHYLGRIAQAARALVAERLLLAEDMFRVLASAESHWQFATTTPAVQSSQEAGVAAGAGVAAAIAFLEGPTVDRQGNVYFSDLASERILRLGTDGIVSVFREKSNATNGLLIDPQERLIACESGSFERDGVVVKGGIPRVTRTDLRTGQIEVLARSSAAVPLQRPNDVTIDGKGRLYFTDLDGVAVYRIDPSGAVTRILAAPAIQRPNGIQISPDDRTLYLVESNRAEGGARLIRAYDLGPDGSVTNMRVHYNFYPGRSADGLSIDVEGNLYAAAGLNRLRGSAETLDVKARVYVISPAGKLLTFVAIPEDTVTNSAFGGPDMKTVYVTAGKTLYTVRTEIAGLPR